MTHSTNKYADIMLDRISQCISEETKNLPALSGAKVSSVNSDGTINVYFPPDDNKIFTNISNQTPFNLKEGDSVELLLKDGSYNNCWIVAKHQDTFNGSFDLAEDMSNFATKEDLQNMQAALLTETDPIFASSPAHSITQQDITRWNDAVVVIPTSTTPKMNSAVGAVGSENAYARGDHVHPTDTSRAPLASPAFTGTPTAPTPTSTSSATQIATKEYVDNKEVPTEVFIAEYGVTTYEEVKTAYDAGKIVAVFYNDYIYQLAYCNDSVGAIFETITTRSSGATYRYTSVQTNNNWATGTIALAPFASPAFTGTPTAPTADVGTNNTQIATTAFVKTALDNKSAPVTSVNNKTGAVVLTASDVGAVTSSRTINGYPLSSNITLSATDVEALPNTTVIPSKTSQLTNDSGFITSASLPEEVFVVTYNGATGDKTFAEIRAAYNADKISILNYNGSTYVLEYCISSYCVFVKAGTAGEGTAEQGFIAYVICTSGDEWSRSTLTITSKTYVDNLVNSLGTLLNFKGTKATVAELPSSGNNTGDVWIVTEDSAEYVWNGTAWEKLGLTIDLSGYVPTSRTVNGKALSANISLSASDVGALPSSTDLSVYMQKGVDYVTAGQKSGTTLGERATAEGVETTASGNYSHAEGYSATASGNHSHAEGRYTTASGVESHAEGNNTVAQRRSQHVFGEYNVLDTTGSTTSQKGSYVEIVGNGTSNSYRSNARTLDWSGNEVLAGKLTVGTGPTNNMDVTTKQYVDDAVPTKTSDLTNDSGFITSSDIPVTSVNSKTGTVVLTAADVGAAASSHNHNIQDLTNFSSCVYDATASRTKNTVLAAPNGSNGAASFRALVAADIPTHNHAAGDINSGTLGVARGGTGAASFTANCVVMSGSSTTAALTTRAVTNNTSATALAANTNIPTQNTVYYGLNHRLNRTTAVNAADTGYTTIMARGMGLRNADTNPSLNGAINWTYG